MGERESGGREKKEKERERGGGEKKRIGREGVGKEGESKKCSCMMVLYSYI